MAGYIFKPKSYLHFCKKWQRVLNAGPQPTPFFHMTELYSARGYYAGWSAEDRAEVLRLAVDTVRKHTYGGISVQFSQSEFENEAPDGWAQIYGSMYTTACVMALRTTCIWLQDRGDDSRVAYVFERGNRFGREADGVIEAASNLPEAITEYRYHSHTMINKQDAYGLQAADMLAWIMTTVRVGVTNNHTMNAFRPHIRSVVKGQDAKYRLFQPSGEIMRRFIAENLNPTRLVVVPKMKDARNRRLR